MSDIFVYLTKRFIPQTWMNITVVNNKKNGHRRSFHQWHYGKWCLYTDILILLCGGFSVESFDGFIWMITQNKWEEKRKLVLSYMKTSTSSDIYFTRIFKSSNLLKEHEKRGGILKKRYSRLTIFFSYIPFTDDIRKANVIICFLKPTFCGTTTEEE